MPEFIAKVEVEFEVYCERCGEGLDGTGQNGGLPYVSVEPCKNCSKESYDEGYADGESGQ